MRVYYGASAGPSAGAYQLIEAASLGTSECEFAMFGATLAVGDFDGDGHDDLAIGAPRGCETVGSSPGVAGGAVYVVHGRDGGLQPDVSYRISQGWVEIYDEAERGDLFGQALAAADFDGDGADDLAIGVPGEDHFVGAVHVVMGNRPYGLIYYNSVFWLPGAFGETPQELEQFGASLAAGDFDGDGFADDLAIGHPGEDYFDLDASGAVTVLMGAHCRIGTSGRHDVLRNGYALPGEIQARQQTGGALATGDFDGNGRTDLAVGVPFHDRSGGSGDAGNMVVVYGDRGLLIDGFESGAVDRWSRFVPEPSCEP